jgi:hypothetical protein
VPAGFFVGRGRGGRPCHRDESGPAFDIQLVRRGSLPKALKRRITMSEEKVLCSNVLTIRFDQLEDNRVTWYVEPDDIIVETQALSLFDLAGCGAPLCALGIRALWKLCIDGLVFNALEQANSIEVEVGKRLAAEPERAVLEAVPEGVTIN